MRGLRTLSETMWGRNLQRWIGEALSDAPLRRRRAEHAVHELLASRGQLSGQPAAWRIQSLRTGQDRIGFVCSDDHDRQVLVRIAWTDVGERDLEAQRR